MLEWSKQVFESADFGWAMLPAGVLLGVMTAFSCGCNYAMLAAVSSYAASREQAGGRGQAILLPVSFTLGAVTFMALLGAGLGFLGETLTGSFKFTAQLTGGIATVLFGLVALDVLPVKIKIPKLKMERVPVGFAGACLFGFVVGGLAMACSLCCGPGLPVALGIATASRKVVWTALILAMFGVGYGLPFGAAMAGVSLSRSSEIANRLAKPIRLVAGVALVLAGLWMLSSVAF